MITTSTGAKKIENTDNWREIFDAHNDSVDAEDKLAQDTAPIVNGNKSTTGASAGEYVLVRNSSITGITDGAYKAAQAIPANTAIDSTYLTAITGGIANDLNSNCPEIVSNSNGTAYKYPNGFMICTKRVTVSSHAINVAWGSCYESASSIGLGSWPVSFTATPIEQLTVGQGTQIGCWVSRVDGASKTSAGQVSVIRPNSSTGKVAIDVVGFGMWK